MKKLKKLFLAIALIFGLTSIIPSLAFVKNIASASPYFPYVLVEGFQEEANVGSRYYLIDGQAMAFVGVGVEPTGADVSVSVKNPLGVLLDVHTDDNGDYVSVLSRGTYTVTYTIEAQDISHVLKFVAVEGIYSFEFEENSNKIIPATMNINHTGKVVLPMPSVLDEDGEEIEDAEVIVRVLKPGDLGQLSNSELVLNGGYYEFSVNAVGIWTVEYMYKSQDDRVLASTTKSITANTSHNNTYTLTYVYNSTLPTTAVTGVETTLPSVTAKNPADNEVQVYYTISAKKVVYNPQTGVVDSNIDVTADVISGSTFTPNADGDYLITYVVKDFFGNSAATSTFPISGVKDSKAPEVKVVKAYAETPDLTYDASFDISAKTAIKNFVLPAIWAEDNQIDNSLSKLTLTRKIVRTNGDVIFESNVNPNKELVFNYDDTSYTVDPLTQELATLADGVTFGSGTYNVTYIAKDSAGNESTSLSYRVILESGFVDDTAPTVTWSDTEAFPFNTRIGDKITFAAPTTQDDVDSRIRMTISYFFFNGTEPLDNEWIVLEAEGGIYTVEVESAQKLYIKATAQDSHENKDSITAQIVIIDTNDTVAPEISDFDDVLGNVYIQGNELTLKSITVEDDYIDFVSLDYYVEVKLADESVITLNAYDAEISVVDSNKLKIENAKLLASFAGDYTVYFIAKDLKNNYIMSHYTFNVASYDEQTEIAFSKLPATLNGGTLELGSKLSLPQAELTAPADATKSYIVRVINGPTGYVINKYEFKPTKVGTYTIEYYGTVVVGVETTNPSKTFTVEVKDTTAPVIGDVYVSPVVALNTEFIFPLFTATDLSEIDRENSKVVLSSKSFGTKTVYYGTTTETKVTLGYNEIYTLAFTVKDIYGNTSTLSKTMKVGDTDAPVIELDEEDELLVPETMTVGSKLIIDLDKITVYDLVDTELSVDDLVITVTRDGTTVENDFADSISNYRYTLSEAGTYTLKLSVTDAAGNISEVITRTITVTEAVNDGVETTEVIGIVLIVVSALILAGAVVYFIISKRKADKFKV